MKRKRSLLQIPNNIIWNNGYNLTPVSFTLYAYLKSQVYLHGTSLTITHDKTLKMFGIKDARTLKRAIKNLYENNLLIGEINLNKHNVTNVIFNDIPVDTSFTQLPTSLLSRVQDIGCIGYRLLYYYESKTKTSRGFSFPSYIEISNTLKLSEPTIAKYNKILQENKLLKITKHELKPTNLYDQNDKTIFNKYNNHYIVLANNM